MSIIGTSSLYMFGGHSGQKHLRDLYVFHTDKLTWHHVAAVQGPFPPGLRGHTATVKQDKIYFFGGYDGGGRSNELYILNTRTFFCI
jgi:N-acetylneuraminic acid mutarotase